MTATLDRILPRTLCRFGETSFVAVLALVVVLLPPAAAAQEDRLWESLGPRVIIGSAEIRVADQEATGAVNSVAPHPTDPDEMFIGAVNSGVWRTDNATDASPVWVDVSANLPSLSIGTVVYDPADPSFDTLLVGAGRYSASSRRGGARFGVYRTQDRGDTWVDIDGVVLDGESVNAIAADGDRVLVSTGGNVAGQGLFLGRFAAGVWNWDLLSGRVPPGGGPAVLPAGRTYDVEADPTVADRYYTMNSSGVYRLTLPAASPQDAVWTKVSNAAIDAQLGAAGGAAHGRLAIGPGGEVFVAISTAAQVLSALWRSPDGSVGWESLDTPIGSTLGRWFLAVVADPSDGNIVYVGGGGEESEFRIDASQDSGSQVSSITRGGTASDSVPHADVRDLRFDAAGDLIEGDDGGVYKQTHPADATGDWFSLNGNLTATEYLDMAWDAVSHVALGGAIDNGTSIQNDFVRDRWLRIDGGDGGDAVVDDVGSAIQSQRYTSSQRLRGFMRQTFDQNNTLLGTSLAPMTPPVCGGAPCFAPDWPFITPIAVNTVNPIRLVAGGRNGVFESTDQGQTIVQLLDSGGAAVPGVNDRGSNDPLAAGADGNADALYLGSRDDVWVRTGGGFGSAMTRTDPAPGRNQTIVDVVIDPGDDQSAFAIDEGGAVFWTRNAGNAWIDVTGNLAAATSSALRSIAYSTSNAAGALIVGTDSGVVIARGDGSSVVDAGGDPIPFTDWAPLGLGLPIVPVYDLEYDAADELLVAGTLGRGAWALNMEERDPIDVVLVMDKSGSMREPACPECVDKMSVMQDAAELFIQTWQMFSDAGDRIAAVFFDSTVEAFTDAGGNELSTLNASGDDVVDYIRSERAGGATAMGGGVQTAVDLFDDDARPRSLIVLTDGVQNRDPMIELADDDVYEIRNIGRPGSGVAPTDPPTRLDRALDVTLNTIGVGVTPAFEAKLNAVSGGTGGLHKTTTDADADLRRFYIEQLVDTLRDASPQLIDYRYAAVVAGGSDVQSFGINAGAKKVVFSVSWRRSDDRPTVSIFKDGKDVTKSANEHRSGSFYDVFSFVVGEGGKIPSSQGDWKVRVKSPVRVDYEIAALADDGTLDYEFEAIPERLQAGDATVLAAEVQLNGLPYGDDVNVRVEIGIPQESLATVLALTPMPKEYKPQDGETPAETKLRYLLLEDPEFRERISRRRSAKTLKRTGAGRFSAPFSDTKIAGVYKLSFLIEGAGSRTGDFERREERFFLVEAGPFAPGSSEIRTVEAASKGDATTVTVRIRPRDVHGNYLGPGEAGQIVAAVVGGESAAVTDVGEGWYELVLKAVGKDPEIRILIGDDEVAVGVPGKIDVK